MPLDSYDKSEILTKVVPEIMCLNKFEHPNVVKFIEYISTNDFLYLVTEYCSVCMKVKY